MSLQLLHVTTWEPDPHQTNHQMPAVRREEDSEPESALDLFLTERSRLFRVAYRVIGEVGGAEDVVQETWLRWQHTDHQEIRNPAAFLTTTTSHLAINMIQSARHRHETPSQSLPASLEDASPAPEQAVDRAQAADEIIGLLMRHLSPSQRAAYLLRKGFDYPYRDVAIVLHISTANARRLVHRAQESLAGAKTRHVDPDAHRALVQAFQAAARDGELRNLETLLARDIRPRSLPRIPRETDPNRSQRSSLGAGWPTSPLAA